MMLGPRVIEDDLTITQETKIRQTVRAVILGQDHHVLMVYSHLFDDYTFPGGGIKWGETDHDALKRELKEEIGADEIEVISYIGAMEELRYGLHDLASCYLQTSRYYHVRILSTSTQNLMMREALHGLEPRYVSIDDALVHNQNRQHDERHQQRGLKTVLIRESYVLKHLKEMIIHEKI
jgi:dUTP pyrophosphatase